MSLNDRIISKHQAFSKRVFMSEIVIYEDGNVRLETAVEYESIWLTQNQIAELFGVNRPAITKHLKSPLGDP